MNPEFYKIFPPKLKEAVCKLKHMEGGLTEMRFRVGGPVMLLYGNKERYLSSEYICTDQIQYAYLVTQNEMKEMMEYISNYSFYAYEEEMKQGYITIQGGHRIGFSGRVVLAEGEIRTIRYISFINIRISHQIFGCAESLIPYLMDEDRLRHTLIVSPPGGGKTTMLRDAIRLLSDGMSGVYKVRGRKVGVVDERSELAACYHGIPQNKIGIRTDVMDCCPKQIGIQLLLRSMSPEVIAVDEIGTKEDALMVMKAVRSGCSILATVHGDGYQEWTKNGGGTQAVLPDNVFERYVFLSDSKHPGKVDKIWDRDYKEVSVGC